ncbi:MAG: YncE family protein, partial [Planctomycetota bacterium]
SACYALHALAAAGRPMDARAKQLIERLAKDTVDKLGTGCPGTPFVQVSALWSCREHAELGDDVEAVLRWVEGAVEPPGCSRALGLCHPNGIVEMVAQVEHPTATRIALKLVPMLLRSQEADGGWGDATFHAFAALERHGLLDRLRTLPPLPPDWRVVRSIPAPVSHRFSVLAFDDGVIWMNDPKNATAVAMSPEDGRVVRTVELPKRPGCVAFGAWGGSLWVFPGQPKESDKPLYQVDSKTGEVVRKIPIPFEVRHFAGLIRSEGRVLICDQWEGCVRAFDPDAPAEHEERRLAAGMPDFAASVGREIWALDSWAPAIVKTNLEGELLDWGERPFGWAAIAWDGEHLWAFDQKNKRICMIEKNVPDAERDAAAARAKELLKGQRHGFRHDPMKYVEEAEGLQAALVRKLVFKKPKEGDEKVIRAEIDKVLAEQRGDGALGDDFNDTADKVLKLLSLGCPPEGREVALALDWIEKAAGGTDVDMRRFLEVSVGAGRTGSPLVKGELERMAKRTVEGLGGGCPGTPYAQLRVLWLGRGAADVGREIESILKWLEDAVEPPGCSRTLGLCYIWGIFETLGEIDHPSAVRITAKLVPMIVRCQGDDGGWKDCYGKDKSLWFFRALSLHGLLEPLRELPPLPPDWRIARSIPAPGEKPGNIGFGHGHLWVLGDGALTAVSEEDGSVIRRVKLARRPGRNHFALAATPRRARCGGTSRSP